MLRRMKINQAKSKCSMWVLRRRNMEYLPKHKMKKVAKRLKIEKLKRLKISSVSTSIKVKARLKIN